MNTDIEDENQAVKYAGFWQRFGAMIIDLIVLILVLSIPLVLLFRFFISPIVFETPVGELSVQSIVEQILTLALTLVFWLYFAATPGKILLSLKIRDANTLGEPSFKQYFIRYFAYLISALPLFLGYIWVAFDEKKQAWHDKLAKTVVIQCEEEETPQDDNNKQEEGEEEKVNDVVEDEA